MKAYKHLQTLLLLCTFYIFSACESHGIKDPDMNLQTSETTKPIAHWETENMKLYSIQFPKNWISKGLDSDAEGIMITSPKADTSDHFFENVSVKTADFSTSPISLDKFSDIIEGSYDKVLTEYKLLKKSKSTLNGEGYVLLTYTGKTRFTKDITVKFTQHLFMNKNHGFLVTATTKSGDSEELASTVSKIMSSFQLK